MTGPGISTWLIFPKYQEKPNIGSGIRENLMSSANRKLVGLGEAILLTQLREARLLDGETGRTYKACVDLVTT